MCPLATKAMKPLFCSVTFLVLSTSVLAQSDGDYRSKSTTGTWSNASSWEVYDVILIAVGGWKNASTPPLANTNVTIQNGHTITMTADAACGNLTVNGIIEMGSNELTLNGTLTNTGSIKANGNSSMVINGTGSLSLALSQEVGGTTNKLSRFTVNRGSTPGGGSVTLDGALQVSEHVTLSGGTLNSGGYLTLLSTASATASIDELDTTKASINGEVKVQRYIPGGDRDWRFMTAPVTSTGGMSANWQQQIFITGPLSTGGSICPSFTANTNNGIDPTQSGNYSVFTYSSGTWQPVTNTLTTLHSPGMGMRLFYRGARTQRCSIIDGTNATPQGVVLEATGTVGKGTVALSFTAASDGWMLAGNPYPSAINWDASDWNTSRTSAGNTVNNAIYIYNPAVNGYSSYVNGVSDGNGCSNIISSGQAFFVKADNTSAVLTFKESYKSGLTGDIFGKRGSKPQLSLLVTSGTYEDRVTCYLEAGAEVGFDRNRDAYKIQLGSHGIALRKLHDTVMLAIASLCPLVNEQHLVDTFVICTGFKEGDAFSLEGTYNEHWPKEKSGWVLDQLSGKIYSMEDLAGIVLKAYSKEQFLLMIGKEFYNGVGLPEKTKGKEIKVVPNPLVDNILSIQSNEELVGSVRIYNRIGMVVWKGNVNCELGRCVSDLSTLNSGYYLAEFKTAGGTSYRTPFVK